MKIIYYLVIYYKSKNNPEDIEISCKPFSTKAKAEEYMTNHAEALIERMTHWKIKKVDLSKYPEGIWL